MGAPRCRRRGCPLTAASAQLGNVPGEDLADVRQLRLPRERVLHVPQRRRDVHQERRILLYLVDEDEPPSVLQLALDGEEIEERDELPLVDARPSLPRELAQVPA